MNWHSPVTQTSLCLLQKPATVAGANRSRLFSLFISLFFFSSNLSAQDNTASDYQQVIRTRSEKIVNTLSLSNQGSFNAVVNALMGQYSTINTVHEQNKINTEKIKAQSLSKEATDLALQQEESKKNELLRQQHELFIAQLNKYLSAEQIELVKDGMTYRVFPITYAGYLDMLPQLTTEQKEQIYTWLKEARELAIDAESSDKKHAVFGKYKGRINNYLSKAGYDMNKESKAWQQRVKERQSQSN